MRLFTISRRPKPIPTPKAPINTLRVVKSIFTTEKATRTPIIIIEYLNNNEIVLVLVESRKGTLSRRDLAVVSKTLENLKER